MQRDILTISDGLIEPPSEPMVFRTITLICHYDLRMNILLHTTQEMKDIYYKWMKPRGLMDCVSYILHESEFEDGLRIDTLGVYPNTIVVNWLRLENQMTIITGVKSLAGCIE